MTGQRKRVLKDFRKVKVGRRYITDYGVQDGMRFLFRTLRNDKRR